MSDEFDKAFWDEHDRGHGASCIGRPNPRLVAAAGDLRPGTALDAGCGEGADAIWLASRGWRVTAVDGATTALRRAQDRAESHGAEVTSRIDWVQADLTTWTPTEEHFDLVCTQYVHVPGGEREAMFRRLAASVAPGGTLLIVGHDRSDPPTTHLQCPAADRYLTAEQAAAGLDPERWDIAVAERSPRPANDHDGQQVTVHDVVLRARKHP